MNVIETLGLNADPHRIDIAVLVDDQPSAIGATLGGRRSDADRLAYVDSL